MNIIDYIPVGRNNAVSRTELSIATGLEDRIIRDMIHKARGEVAILNMQDGRGDFLPDKNDPVEVALLYAYEKQETARKDSIEWSLNGVRRAIRDVQVNDQRTP